MVVAAGWAEFPNVPTFPGQQAYGGAVLHSRAYRNATPFLGKRVLVVGFGNSGAEIALDLCEAGVTTALSVRSPVCLLPRDLLGIPILNFALARGFVPAKVLDFLNEPFLRLAIGSPKSLGMRVAAKGALQMIEEDEKVPVIDVGAVKKIREGKIKVFGGVERFDAKGVAFEGGVRADFDAVVLATGFKPDYRPLLPDALGALDGAGRPKISDRRTSEPGLYFVGSRVSVRGQLREIALGARRVAADAKAFLQTRGA